ncbi:MAG TPA: autotransporter-associated beta strand repeat-containing protein, partial [Phycisphaerae bacterium]|nr:autotransporter-associated beta strand repeat-containing protein [Phycisphaerae bacterium]
GSALTTQTINTSFGDSAYSGTYNGHSGDTNGSELDAGYGVIENGYLYLLLTGDMEDNGNHLNIFIADGRTGQSTLAAGMGQTLDTINGSEFSPNFGHGATYALDVNIANGSPTASPNVYMNYYNLFAGANVNGYAGSFSVNGTTNDSPNTETGFIEAFNDSHVSTMGTADAAAGTNADSLTGYEVAIPLTSLGDPTGTIEVMAGVNGGGDNGFSNQFLAGLPVGSGNVKNSLSPFYLSSNSAGFNFSTTAGIFFTVPAAATPTLYWAGSGTVTTGDHKTWDINTNQNWQSGGTGYVYADGSSVIFDDTGSPNANVTLNTTVNPGSVTFNNNSVSYVISGTGSIAGSTNLVKGGSGQVTLSTANTYTGGTNINDGTLIVGNAAAIPTGSSLTISDG